LAELLTTVTACVPLFPFQAAIVPSRVPKRNKADVLPGISKIALLLLYTVPLGLPCAGAGAAAGIVTDGSNGTAVAPARVSTATEPLPALSIQIAGPTETPHGLINVGSVTVAFTVAPSEMIFVCTYVLLVWAKAPIEKMLDRARTAPGRNQFLFAMGLKEDKVLPNEADISEKYDIELLFNILISSTVQN
jgi:hypothetical protein